MSYTHTYSHENKYSLINKQIVYSNKWDIYERYVYDGFSHQQFSLELSRQTTHTDYFIIAVKFCIEPATFQKNWTEKWCTICNKIYQTVLLRFEFKVHLIIYKLNINHLNLYKREKQISKQIFTCTFWVNLESGTSVGSFFKATESTSSLLYENKVYNKYTNSKWLNSNTNISHNINFSYLPYKSCTHINYCNNIYTNIF